MRKTRYLTGTILGTALIAMAGGLATPALAQEAQTSAQTAPAPADAQEEEEGEAIVVTGTLFASTEATPSPVTVISAESMEQRGLSTVQDAIQTLASNNGPALTNSFTANGAFAAGGSAVSLRGLSTNSTLVLFDGLRAAYYPLADDGARNFVDLNTIPDDIIERVEVLRDGASSTYGADAIAGVVNIITKKEVKGVSGRAEAGISSRGDASTYRLALTAGTGDLDENGFNAYLSGFWFRSDALYNRDRPFPYNTNDLSSLCYEGTCGPDGRANGLTNGVFLGVTNQGNYIVRPYNAANTAAQGPWQNLGPCTRGSFYTLNATDRATAGGAVSPSTVCQVDLSNAYGSITPDIERFGVSGRVTARLGDALEAYGELNFVQSNVGFYSGAPNSPSANANTGIFYNRFSTSTAAGRAAGSGILALPVYVCPRVNGVSAVMVNGVPTVPGCTAATPGATLNPNNPFAAQGLVARLTGVDQEILPRTMTRNRAYRAAFGVSGNLSDNITFDVGATAMHVDLRRIARGFMHVQHLLDVVADGTYNFRNPELNSQAVEDYLRPENVGNSTSDQYQLQASLATSLAELPGGSLQFGAGGSIRYEAVDAPSFNSDINGPTQRYFTFNAFGTKGNRTITSLFAELNAPITSFLDVNASGRYDRYSSGQDAFSPKIGVKLTPIPELLVRGTYSRGFRIPSFGEANALPTTGFVTATAATYNDAYLATYGCSTATFSSCPLYLRGTYGLTVLASPNLEPEKSRSFTAGIQFEPIRNVVFSVDYYNIKKSGAITTPETAGAIAAYYAGQPIPTGITVVADAPDPNNPANLPRIAFVQSPLINANTLKAEGLDFTASVDFDVTDSFRIHTSVEATYILFLGTEFPSGAVEQYEGTLGNFNLTAGSGTPEWRGTWLTSLQFGDFQVNGTLNYFGGYNLSAMDQHTGYKDCGLSSGFTPCDVSAYTTFDLNARIRVNDQFTFYGTVNNLFDKLPPIDPVTYGANNYNPVQGGNGILGRYFKAGVRFNF